MSKVMSSIQLSSSFAGKVNWWGILWPIATRDQQFWLFLSEDWNWDDVASVMLISLSKLMHRCKKKRWDQNKKNVKKRKKTWQE